MTGSHVGKFFERVSNLLGIVSGLFLVGIMLIMVREAIGRYIFNSPWDWAPDISTQLMLAGMFWATSYVLSANGFVNVDIFYAKFSPVKQAIVDIFGNLAGLAYLGVLFWQAVEITINSYVLKTKTYGMAPIPLAVPGIVMLIGTLLFVLQCFWQIHLKLAFIRGSLKGRGQ